MRARITYFLVLRESELNGSKSGVFKWKKPGEEFQPKCIMSIVTTGIIQAVAAV